MKTNNCLPRLWTACVLAGALWLPATRIHAQTSASDTVTVTKVVTNTVVNTVIVSNTVSVAAPTPAPVATGLARVAVVPATYMETDRSRFLHQLNEKMGIDDPNVIENPGFTAHLINALVNLRKFDVMEREDIRRVADELNFAESDYADTEKCVRMGHMLNAQYVVIPQLRFIDLRSESQDIPFIGQTQKKYFGVLGTYVRVIDVATGRIVSSDMAEAKWVASEAHNELDRIAQSHTLIDQLMDLASRQSASVVADVVYPIRVVAVTGNQVTFNRGHGAMEEGESLKIYHAGKEMFDPDTKKSLGSEEVEIGTAQVIHVNPRTSIANIVTLEPGQTVFEGDIARRVQKPAWHPPVQDNTTPKLD